MSEQNVQGLASAISSITGDPELMDRLRQAVGASQNAQERSGDAAETAPVARGGGAQSKATADRRKLLEALRPFLSTERREKADTLINVIALLDSGILDMIRKGDGR